jgi:hypothetical protein
MSGFDFLSIRDFFLIYAWATNLKKFKQLGKNRHRLRIEQEIVKNCEQRKIYLFNRIADVWNKLPNEVVQASKWCKPFSQQFQSKIGQISPEHEITLRVYF